MALARPYEQEQMARDALLERAARRDYWRDIFRTMWHLAFWVAAGLTIILVTGAVSLLAYRLMLAIGRLPEERRWFR